MCEACGVAGWAAGRRGQVAAGAPFQDLALALVEMAVTTALVVNLSGRAFRSGALATERLSLQKILGKLFHRQA